jgi:hypothetical protein
MNPSEVAPGPGPTKFDGYKAQADSAATPEERELAEAFDAFYQSVHAERFGAAEPPCAEPLGALRQGRVRPGAPRRRRSVDG